MRDDRSGPRRAAASRRRAARRCASSARAEAGAGRSTWGSGVAPWARRYRGMPLGCRDCSDRHRTRKELGGRTPPRDRSRCRSRGRRRPDRRLRPWTVLRRDVRVPGQPAPALPAARRAPLGDERPTQLEERIRVANAFVPHAGHRLHGLRRRRRHRAHLPVRPRSRGSSRRTSGTSHRARASSSGSRALNLFLHDIYHDQQILRDGIVPAELVFGAAALPARDGRASTCRTASTRTSSAPT